MQWAAQERESTWNPCLHHTISYQCRSAPRSECGGQRDVVRACLGALRQLAHSDTVKKLLAESGAIEQVWGAGHGGGTQRDVRRGSMVRFRVEGMGAAL